MENINLQASGTELAEDHIAFRRKSFTRTVTLWTLYVAYLMVCWFIGIMNFTLYVVGIAASIAVWFIILRGIGFSVGRFWQYYRGTPVCFDKAMRDLQQYKELRECLECLNPNDYYHLGHDVYVFKNTNDAVHFKLRFG